MEGLKYTEIKKNIMKAYKDISKDILKNIFKGSYDRQEKYVKISLSRKKEVKNYL